MGTAVAPEGFVYIGACLSLFWCDIKILYREQWEVCPKAVWRRKEWI
jgi:hypothetical protein